MTPNAFKTINVEVTGKGIVALRKSYGVKPNDLVNLPAKIQVRNYNPCNDEVLVPDVDHPDFPSSVGALLECETIVGPMASGWVMDPETGDSLRMMGRFETEDLYARMFV